MSAVKAKHTPGPWREDTDPGCTGVIGPDGFMVADCAIFSLRRGAPTQERCEANARLIAAAPDLLAACLEVTKCGNGGAKLSRAASDKVRAAITKATQP